ncbi:MAG TPA: isopeptide-forming domain-containing fimbrial protein [Sedimentisphaerales bacterium]|nr:isopeptide-forming domain-containing fimbrial protein [Sedimentisphaerales bacterium]HRS09612.1 isopeptide-forming domain-containing fimbrial protein [Sedimentisphaerales bacterium]HRV46293.1 isopeptide-forming domain-containing fimbrial protein [Sedimentisphaerales bacterium]
MRSEKRKATINRYGIILSSLFLAMAAAGPTMVQARSAYVIAEITNSAEPLPVLAYDIGPDGSLTFQARQTIPFRAGGAVGMAIDWESGYIFITYEFSNALEILDARTMADVGTVVAPGAENLAGVVYDETRNLLYTVDRATNKLYVYTWNASTGRLALFPGAPFALEGSTAYGIDLDEARGLLYTASGNRTIRVYETSTWSLVREYELNRSAVSIALDLYNELIYTGAGYFGDTSLNQYNMITGKSKAVSVDETAGVMGIAVDPVSNLVYVTTGLSNLPGGDDLLCYDPNLVLVSSILDIGNPTDIVIPARDIGYNPLGFVKRIATDAEPDEEEEIYVSAGETITYQLSFANLSLIREVSIVDTLPSEVTFVEADGDGDTGRYDAATHTYTWLLPSVEAGSQTCLELRAKVDPRVPAGTRIRNRATIRTRVIPPTSVSVDALVRGGDWKPLTLSKSVIGDSRREDGVAYANAGETVSYAIAFSNENNNYPVTKVSIVDTLPPEMTFVNAESTSGTASYDPVNHTYTCSYASLAAGATGQITLTAQIRDDVPAGTVLTNSVVLTTNETQPTTATADVTVWPSRLQPLGLTKTITAGGTEPKEDGTRYVGIGENITFRICCDNRDNTVPVEDITILDFLPPQLAFVSAEGDGQFGHYDAQTHTYAWSIASLAAGESICLEIVTQVKAGTPAGTVIVNRATVDNDQIEATTDQIEVTVKPIDRVLNVAKRISDGATMDDSKTQYVGIGTEITYEICFDSNGSSHRIQGLSLVDVLPPEVTFVSADGDGIYGSYDRDKHTYTWSYPSLLPDSSACVEIVVGVREETKPGTVIENSVTIDSDEAEPQTARVTAIATQAKPKPLLLTKTVTGGVQGMNDQGTMYVAAGQEVTYTVCVQNDNHQRVSNVTIVDTLPAEVTFVTAGGDGDSGSYDRANHTYTWRYATLEAGEKVCADIVVRVNDDARPGSTVTNHVRAACDEVLPAETDTEVTVELEPPIVTKTVMASADGKVSAGCVHPGGEVTYEICIENTNDAVLTGVFVVDHLPDGVTFVRVEGDGGSGYYDPPSHTFTWAYPVLRPGAVQCVRLTVRLDYDLTPGQIVVNSVSLDAAETPVVTASVEVCVGDAPLPVALTFSPLILGRTGYNPSDCLTALLVFPADIKQSDIRLETLSLDPGNIAAGARSVTVAKGKVQIRATFDLIEVLDAIPDNGITTLYVGGTLQSGLPFVGQGTVLVVAERPF